MKMVCLDEYVKDMWANSLTVLNGKALHISTSPNLQEESAYIQDTGLNYYSHIKNMFVVFLSLGGRNPRARFETTFHVTIYCTEINELMNLKLQIEVKMEVLNSITIKLHCYVFNHGQRNGIHCYIHQFKRYFHHVRHSFVSHFLSYKSYLTALVHL
jgi:hypothetical protein